MATPTDDELEEMSRCWGVSIDRLRFLATCPHYDSKPHIRVDQFKDPYDRHMAKAIREAIRASWLPADAAKIAKVTVKEMEAFICRHGIIWPAGCRRRKAGKRAFGGVEENLLAKGKISMKEAVRLGIEQGLTAKETSEKYDFSTPGLYHAADRLGLRFVRHYDKYAQPSELPKTPSV